MKLFHLFSILLVLKNCLLLAQPLCTMKQYSLSDGYLQGKVNDILQDRNGIIWIGTSNGLTQFDGYTFKNIKSYPDDDGFSMGTSNINSLFLNSQGDIWCKNQDGRAYLYDVRNKAFYDVFKGVEPEEKKIGAVAEVFTLKKGVTWIVCKGGECLRIDDVLCKEGKGIGRYRMKGNKVFSIHQDKDGDEWIMTNNGIEIIGKKKFNNNSTFVNLVETDGCIWLTDGDSLMKFTVSTGILDRVELPSGINRILFIKLLKNNRLAIGTLSNGLYLFSIESGSCEIINVNVATNSPNEVFEVMEDNFGDLWMLNRQPGIIHYQKATGKVSILQSPQNADLQFELPNKTMIHEDQYGNMWVIPKGGNLCYFDREDQALKHYYVNSKNSQSIIAPFIRYFYSDNQKNIWFGDKNTLGKLSFFKSNFSIIPIKKDEIEVRSLMIDRIRNTWVGSKNGMLKILDRKNRLLGYVSENGYISSSPLKFKGNVYSMMEDDEGNIWIGTRGYGLYLFERKNNQAYSFNVKHFQADTSDKYSISNNNIFSLFQDSRKRVWVGTYGGGINLVKRNTDGTIRFIHHENQLKGYPKSERSTNVRCITEYDNKTIMVGTVDGLITFASDFSLPEKIQFFRNTRKKGNKQSMISSDVFCIFCDNSKNIFVLTHNGGINQILSNDLYSEEIRFSSFTEREGLLSDQTLSMTEDNHGDLWLISKQSFSKYSPKQRKAEHFNGFIFNNDILFSESLPVITPDGNIMMGTNKGILMYSSRNDSKPQVTSPGIVFTDIAIQGEKIGQNAMFTEHLRLSPSQRNLAIQFAAIDYRASEEIQYAYMMEGLDEQWNFSGKERTANYINLRHGKYRFMVKSTNSEGIWTENIRTLDIEVRPKILETIWAWVLIMVMFIVVIEVVMYLSFSFYRLRNEVIIEKKVSELKLNFFTEISHELRTPLTLISSPISDVLENESLSEVAVRHLQIVRKNTDRMLRMVNQILDFRKIQHNKMSLLVEETEIVSFTRQIMDGFHLLAQEKGIDFQLRTSLGNLYLWVDKDKFEKVLFNLLSNAFKNTPSGKAVWVAIDTTQEQAHLSVIDKGNGIIPQIINTIFDRFESILSKEHLRNSTGVGLSLVKEYVALHHGSVDVSSAPGEGSEFKLSFPLGTQHFEEDKKVEIIRAERHTICHQAEEEFIERRALAKGTEKNKTTVLIVEDNLELLQFLNDVLSRQYFVIEAVNGKDGYEKAMSQIPDIIVSDVMMPEKDGLGMVKDIKENNELCHIPIILLSAKSSLDDRIEGLDHGIDDYIAKPFSANYLKSRIENLLKQRAMLQSYYWNRLESRDQSAKGRQLAPSPPQLCLHDDRFVDRLMDFMEQNIDNPTLSIDDFLRAFSISRTVFFRKMKAMLGISPVDFIIDIRMKRAVQLIQSGITSVSEVSYSCGFSDPNYFGKCFKKHTGLSPSEYKKQLN